MLAEADRRPGRAGLPAAPPIMGSAGGTGVRFAASDEDDSLGDDDKDDDENGSDEDTAAAAAAARRQEASRRRLLAKAKEGVAPARPTKHPVKGLRADELPWLELVESATLPPEALPGRVVLGSTISRLGTGEHCDGSWAAALRSLEQELGLAAPSRYFENVHALVRCDVEPVTFLDDKENSNDGSNGSNGSNRRQHPLHPHLQPDGKPRRFSGGAVRVSAYDNSSKFHVFLLGKGGVRRTPNRWAPPRAASAS